MPPIERLKRKEKNDEQKHGRKGNVYRESEKESPPIPQIGDIANSYLIHLHIDK